MKKIININLSGRVIPIEDSAYEKLQAYIESLRRYFSMEEGRDEIINDIESRIAELMNEKVRKGATCITEADVEEIIASMGRPEDFDADDTKENASASQSTGQEYANTGARTRRRLYRDSSDKFIGGVCSGIANYLNTDPAIIRILFAIITFGGFGLGFLAYILLWIFLPDKPLEGYGGKRLFRNPDDRIIGGVAGGLSAYFNVRSSTLRLIFAAPLLLSILIGILDGISRIGGPIFFPNIIFGSLTATFIFAYIILWIVLPEANSPYEKMEMRGEKVDVNTIRQNVQEGMGNVKERVQNWGEEVKESAKNFGTRAKEFADTRGKKFASEVNDTVRTGGRGIGHAIGVLFKVLFLFIAGTIAFGLFVGVIALIFSGVAWWPINNFLWTSNWQQAYAWGTLIFFLAVPLIGFIIWVIRRILRVRSRNSYLGWTFAFLWTIGWVCATMLAVSISRDISEFEPSDDQIIPITQPANGRMIVAVSEPELEYTGKFGWMNDDGEGWDLTEDTLKLSTVKFSINPSKDSAYQVIVRKYSWGRTNEDARNRASKVQYAVYSYDSILDLSSGFAIDKDSKFRNQQVEVEILVPIGKKIRFDESIRSKLNPSQVKVRRGKKTVNVMINGNYSFPYRTDVDYTMGVDGDLKDPSGKDVRNKDYRWNGKDSTESLEERERRWEREGQEIKKEKEKNRQKPTSENQESMDDEEISFRSPSPVFSMVKSFF